MLNRCDLDVFWKQKMSGIGADLLEDCCKHVDRRRQEHGRQWLIAVQLAPELQPRMQNVVDDMSLRPTAAGSTRTDTVMLLRLDSGAIECKACTRCLQAHTASASSRAVVSHGRTCAHQPWVVLQRSARTYSDQDHAAAIQPGRCYSCRTQCMVSVHCYTPNADIIRFICTVFSAY